MEVKYKNIISIQASAPIVAVKKKEPADTSVTQGPLKTNRCACINSSG